MEQENIFIMQVCNFLHPDAGKLEELLSKPLDYPYILGQLLFNRMGGVAYYTLQQTNLLHKCNREFKNPLRIIYESAMVQSKSFSAALNALSALLKNVSFPYAVLKGGYLNNLYPKGLRTSNDIDLLLFHSDITKISNILKANGYKQGHIRSGVFTPATRAEIISSSINRGESIPFVKEINLPYMQYCEIDLNFALDYKASGTQDAVEAFLQNSQPAIHTKSSCLYTLDKLDFFIHLCMHLFKEASVMNWVQMGRDLSLYKFSDLYLLLGLFGEEKFYYTLAERIQKYAFKKQCYFALYCTQQLYQLKNNLLQWLLDAIRPSDTGYLKRVYAPEKKVWYQYDMDFTSWMFCPHRKEMLYEVANETTSL